MDSHCPTPAVQMHSMKAGSGYYWVEVDGVKYVFRNHYLHVSDVYDAVQALLKTYGPPVILLDECPRSVTAKMNDHWFEVQSPDLSIMTEQRFFPFVWD